MDLTVFVTSNLTSINNRRKQLTDQIATLDAKAAALQNLVDALKVMDAKQLAALQSSIDAAGITLILQ